MKFDWRSETDETIEHHFNPRMTLPNVMELLADSSQRAAAAHENLTGRHDIRYGERPKESFDLFPARNFDFDTGSGRGGWNCALRQVPFVAHSFELSDPS